MVDWIKTSAQVQAEALETLKAKICAAIDERIEAEARLLGSRSAAHLASYANSSVEAWRNEALVFIAWRDACWLAALELLAQAEGSGDVPSVEDVLAQLPEWGE